MRRSALSALGLSFLPAYFALTLVIGWFSRRPREASNAFLNASRSLPLSIVSASFLAANCGALEIIGLSAMAAQYGVAAFQFYWIGAIPAMVFLALWMLPIYMRSGVRSVPEYLGIRYGPQVQLLNACISALTMLLLAGISLYAMAQVLYVICGMRFTTGAVLSALVVLTYVLIGGVKATIYTEVFQLGVMIAGLLPLCLRSWRFVLSGAPHDSSRWHVWKGMSLLGSQRPLDGLGVVFGLGFVLSFSYWCTDFVLMQRALASRNEAEARQVSLWAGFGKLAFSLVVVIPGLAAYRVFPDLHHATQFDQTLPRMMAAFYGPSLLGIGLTALAASLMSGLAANISGFAAIWTEDIYRRHLVRRREDAHYLRVGRASIIAAVAVTLAASYLSFFFADLMEHVQLIFSLFGAPFWAVFLLAIATRRVTARGALWGFTSGTLLAGLQRLCVARGWLSYGSAMSANFHAAAYGFVCALVVSLLVSGKQPACSAADRPALQFTWAEGFRGKGIGLLWSLAGLLMLACVLLNLYWW